MASLTVVSRPRLPTGDAQDSVHSADGRDMFRRLSEPLPLSEASILALRPALNAPVLNVDFLPVGPARAAIVVFGEEWGGIGVAIGIRSNEGGQVAVFRNRESIEPDVAVSSVLEPALAEAERMGFLFDEDMMAEGTAGQGRSQATALWGRLMGELEMPTPSVERRIEAVDSDNAHGLPPRPGSGAAEATEPIEVMEAFPELVLDDLAAGDEDQFHLDLDLDLDLDLEVSASDLAEEVNERTAFELLVEAKPPIAEPAGRPAPAAAREKAAGHGGPRRKPRKRVAPAVQPGSARMDPVPSQPSLSKFRHLESSAGRSEKDVNETTSSGDAGSALGRIPLVRVNRGRDGSRRVSMLARLLASF